MSRLSKVIVLLVLMIAMMLQGCSPEETQKPEQIKAAVTLLPFADLVTMVGGEHVEVTTLIPPGTSPANFDPPPSAIRDIVSADVYFAVGEVFPFERRPVETAAKSNASLRVVDCSEVVTLQNNNPHYWLKPEYAVRLLHCIDSTLSSIKPEYGETFAANAAKAASVIDSLNNHYAEALRDKQNKTIVVYHPAWGYLADSWGLEEIALEKHGHEPDAHHIADLVTVAKNHRVSAVFVHPQYAERSAQSLAKEINAKTVSIDPLPRDYIGNLDDVGKKFVENLK